MARDVYDRHSSTSLTTLTCPQVRLLSHHRVAFTDPQHRASTLPLMPSVDLPKRPTWTSSTSRNGSNRFVNSLTRNCAALTISLIATYHRHARTHDRPVQARTRYVHGRGEEGSGSIVPAGNLLPDASYRKSKLIREKSGGNDAVRGKLRGAQAATWVDRRPGLELALPRTCYSCCQLGQDTHLVIAAPSQDSCRPRQDVLRRHGPSRRASSESVEAWLYRTTELDRLSKREKSSGQFVLATNHACLSA